MQQKLEGIFKQVYQVKRVQKEIENINQAKVKMGLDVRYIITRPIQISVVVTFTPNKLASIPKLSFLSQLQFKIVLKNTYPTEPPKLYFSFQNVLELNINPYCNYMKLIYPDWGPKVTIIDIIKKIPAFVLQCKEKGLAGKGQWQQKQYFEVQKMLGFRECQNYPVKLIRLQHSQSGMLVIVNNQQILILEQINTQGSYSTSQRIFIQQVISVQKHKNKHLRTLIEIKRASNKFVIEFASDQFHTIIQAVVEAMKICMSRQTQRVVETDSSSSDEEVKQKQEIEFKINENNIEQVQAQIVILQSIVENNPNSNNINQLVDLLKRVVEYYSMKNNSRCSVHLKTLQNIMSNEFMQTLMQSTYNAHSSQPLSAYETIAHYI